MHILIGFSKTKSDKHQPLRNLFFFSFDFWTPTCDPFCSLWKRFQHHVCRTPWNAVYTGTFYLAVCLASVYKNGSFMRRWHDRQILISSNWQQLKTTKKWFSDHNVMTRNSTIHDKFGVICWTDLKLNKNY